MVIDGKVVSRGGNYHSNVLGLLLCAALINLFLIGIMILLRTFLPGVADSHLMSVASKWFLLSLFAAGVAYFHIKSNYRRNTRMFGEQILVSRGRLRGIGLLRANGLDFTIFILSFVALAFGLWTGLLIFAMSFVTA